MIAEDRWTDYHLFVHPEDGKQVGVAAMTLRSTLGTATRGPMTTFPVLRHAGWSFASARVDPHAVATTLQRVEWRDQPLLVYRTKGDDSWSYLRIVRRVATLWGDDERRGDGGEREPRP